jgi:hypothetical protein
MVEHGLLDHPSLGTVEGEARDASLGVPSLPRDVV